MKSLNRQVAIIKPKEPYVAWINSRPGMDEPSTIESLNNDCTALLLPHFDDEEESLHFVKKHYRQIFKMELDSWSTDKKSWPKKINYALFREWFKIELHSEVFDLGQGPIEVDDY
jgi:hypothetical protein